MSAIGIFLTCRAGHLEHRPLESVPPAPGILCEKKVREAKLTKVCREPWVAWKRSRTEGGVRSSWDRIPGPWWDK